MVPRKDGVVVVITAPDGTISWDRMTWEEFMRLRRELEKD